MRISATSKTLDKLKERRRAKKQRDNQRVCHLTTFQDHQSSAYCLFNSRLVWMMVKFHLTSSARLHLPRNQTMKRDNLQDMIRTKRLLQLSWRRLLWRFKIWKVFVCRETWLQSIAIPHSSRNTRKVMLWSTNQVRSELTYYTGAWVRYLIGQDEKGQPVYRICEVISELYYWVLPAILLLNSSWRYWGND
jgi:hypothetical protein